MVKGGDFARSTKTGEFRLVVETDRATGRVTFAGDPKWYPAEEWRTNARPSLPSSLSAEETKK